MQNWNASIERLVAPSPAASRPPLSQFSSLRLLYLAYELTRLIPLCRLMSGLVVYQPHFPFQVWPDFERNRDSADLPGELLCPLTQLRLSCTSGRKVLPACPPCSPWNLPSFTVEFTLSSPCSRLDLPLSPILRSGTLNRRLCSFSF